METPSFWARVAAIFRPQAAVRYRDDPLYFTTLLPHQTPAGINITMENALSIGAVWACVMALTDAIASSPWNIFTFEKDKRVQLPNDPLAYILNVRPNPDMTGVTFRESMLMNALTWGNSYAEIARDMSGRVRELWPLMPHRTTPRRNVETNEIYYEYQEQNGGLTLLPAADVLHYKGAGITGLMGDNLVARAVKSFALAWAQERFASTYFGNNTILGGFLEYPKTLDDKTFNHLRDSWEDRFRGPNKANKPAILEGGAKWVPINNNAEQAQMTNSRKFSVEEICRWFRVPPHKIQHLERSTFNNIEHQSIEFVRDGVMPWARRLEQESDYKLFASRSMSRHTKFDLTPLTQGDFKSRAEGYQIMRRIGVYSANDILRKEGENGIGTEGDIRIVEANMQTLDEVAAAKDPEIFQYHITAGIPTINEVRARLKLPPVPGGDKPSNQIDQGQAADSHADVKPKPPPKPPVVPGGKPAPAAPAEPTPAGKAPDLVRDSIHALFASSLHRYQRVMHNRAADLARHMKGAKFDVALVEARDQLRPKLLEELAPARDLAARLGQRGEDADIFIAADAIDNGADPATIATQLVEKLLTKETP